jgi:hypothetical protein
MLKTCTAYAHLAYNLQADPAHHIPVVNYEDNVYLDSGAANHMMANINNLIGLQSTLTNVSYQTDQLSLQQLQVPSEYW